MRNVNLLIKPASSLCNLRCRYCFYADIADIRDVDSYGIMSEETAALLIDRAFEAVDKGGMVSFMFQGGEPTVAGYDFFEKFTERVTAKRPLDVNVHYAIQTNGMVIDEKWADLFKKNNFLVGVSVDGYRDLHNFNRIDASKKGSFDRVKKTVDLLLKKGVDTNLLCVVTGQCAKHAQKVYTGLKKLGTGYLQFIACLDPLEGERGGSPYSLTPELYGRFLCELFDLWYRDWEQGQYTSIRLFDDYVYLAMGMPAGTCATSGGCGSYFVVEGDGSIFPCDFYVIDEWNMGNIHETTLTDLQRGETSRKFLHEGTQRPAECSECRWLRLCNGGCRRDWEWDQDGHTTNYYCPSFKMFFEHAASRLAHIAQCELRQRGLMR